MACLAHSQIFFISAVGQIEPPFDWLDHRSIQLEGSEQFLGESGHCVPKACADSLHGGLQNLSS